MTWPRAGASKLIHCSVMPLLRRSRASAAGSRDDRCARAAGGVWRGRGHGEEQGEAANIFMAWPFVENSLRNGAILGEWTARGQRGPAGKERLGVEASDRRQGLGHRLRGGHGRDRLLLRHGRGDEGAVARDRRLQCDALADPGRRGDRRRRLARPAQPLAEPGGDAHPPDPRHDVLGDGDPVLLGPGAGAAGAGRRARLRRAADRALSRRA